MRISSVYVHGYFFVENWHTWCPIHEKKIISKKSMGNLLFFHQAMPILKGYVVLFYCWDVVFHYFTNCGSVSIFEIQVQLKYTLAKFIGRFGKSIPGGSPDVRD